MAAVNPLQDKATIVRIRSQLSDAFGRAEERIRERAYQIFLGRGQDAGDSMTDWLEAQSQVLAPVELVVKEQKKNVVVEVSLKGYSPQEIEIEVGVGALRVFGSHTESTAGEKSGASQSSTETVQFYQAVPLPCEVDMAAGEATLLKNGKLKITLPKKADAR